MKNVPNYRWMVCKGMQTVALTTTQREAEAEAARVGGEVHELMPQKNPPDPEYSKELGGGVWSKAYGTPDSIEQFYDFKGTPLSRTRTAVEALTAKQDQGWGGTTEAVDGMKPLLFMTRKALLASKDRAAAKFIPALRPYRLDYTDPSHPEMIFKMPVYKIWVDAKESQKNDAAKQFWEVLEFGETGNGKMDKFALLLRRAMPKFDAKVRKEAEALERALLTMHQIANDLPLKVYRGDFHHKNAAVDTKGNLILLDPLVAEMKWVDAEALWKKLRWPVGKQPKKPKAPKAPRAPKAASKKAEKPVTLTKALLESIGKQIEQKYPPARVTVFDAEDMRVAFPNIEINLWLERSGWTVSVYRTGPLQFVKKKIFQSQWDAISGLWVEVHLAYDQLAKPASVKKATTPKSAKAPSVQSSLLRQFRISEPPAPKPASVKKAGMGASTLYREMQAVGLAPKTKKPTAKKAGAFTAAGLPRLEAKPATKKPTAKPATKKPRAAKKPIAAQKLEGKKLRALVSKIYGEAFDRVPVNMMDLPKIYDMIEQAYAQASSHYSGEKQAEAAAQAAVKQYGESKLK